MSELTTGYKNVYEDIFNSASQAFTKSMDPLTANDEQYYYLSIPMIGIPDYDKEEIVGKDVRKKEYWPFLEDSPKI